MADQSRWTRNRAGEIRCTGNVNAIKVMNPGTVDHFCHQFVPFCHGPPLTGGSQPASRSALSFDSRSRRINARSTMRPRKLTRVKALPALFG